MDITENYGLLRAALTRHFVEAGAMDPVSIATESALLRAASRAGHGIHCPSQEPARTFLERYAKQYGIEPEPLTYDRERYWRDWDRNRGEAWQDGRQT